MKPLARIISGAIVFALLASVPVPAAGQRHQGARHEQSSRGGSQRQSSPGRPGSSHSNNSGHRPGGSGTSAPRGNSSSSSSAKGSAAGPVRGSSGAAPARNNSAVKGNSHKADAVLPSRPGGSNPGNGGSNSGNQGGTRPGGNQHNPGGTRPGDNGHRPGGGNQGTRPGGSGPGHNPGPNPGHGFTPPPGQRPGGGPSHGYGPGGRPRPPMMAPPRRPGRPRFIAPWAPPTPPPAWRPYVGMPSFGTILGITLGTAIGTSLDYLFNGGYVVDGYDADRVFLRNVSQLNYMWPDATLFYGPQGGLTGSEFMYSTLGYNTARYYSVYNNLIGLYGQPAILLTPAGGMGATWFGGNGLFVTLRFQPIQTYEGLRYFTTLSFGN